MSVIEIDGQPVEVVRKNIKNLHLAVYPPNGRVRIAVPTRVDDEAVRIAVVSRLSWIRRKQAALTRQDRQSEREMVARESHYFRGQRYLLEVVERAAPPAVRLHGRALRLCVRPGTTTARRRAVLEEWYRSQLREQMAARLPEWERKVGARADFWSIKRMKTRWGTCNPIAGRIWLNLELAKKSPRCAEYVLVHELVHLSERRHGRGFIREMDRLMPDWRMRRAELNREPLAHEEWHY
jgi:predicted metal-dependent hydrolase